ncbi:hypothetical protein EV426DRAFT_668584 [Tirmania nivea]|nr:hypothetical protein EV426DRAFT_668584 [Tirmania nivea]
MRHDYLEVPRANGPPILLEGRRYVGNRRWLFSEAAKSDKCLIYATNDYNPYMVKHLKVTPRVEARASAIWIEEEEQPFDTRMQADEGVEVQADEGVEVQADEGVEELLEERMQKLVSSSEEITILSLVSQYQEHQAVEEEEKDIFDDMPCEIDKGIEDMVVGDITWKVNLTGISEELLEEIEIVEWENVAEQHGEGLRVGEGSQVEDMERVGQAENNEERKEVFSAERLWDNYHTARATGSSRATGSNSDLVV